MRRPLGSSSRRTRRHRRGRISTPSSTTAQRRRPSRATRARSRPPEPPPRRMPRPQLAHECGGRSLGLADAAPEANDTGAGDRGRRLARAHARQVYRGRTRCILASHDDAKSRADCVRPPLARPAKRDGGTMGARALLIGIAAVRAGLYSLYSQRFSYISYSYTRVAGRRNVRGRRLAHRWPYICN